VSTLTNASSSRGLDLTLAGLIGWAGFGVGAICATSLGLLVFVLISIARTAIHERQAAA
jgi:hypothetical protein